MKKRTWITVGIAIALVATILLWLLRPTPWFSESAFDLLREGMSEAEVEEVLGRPAGDYRTYGFEAYRYPSSVGGVPIKRAGRSWMEIEELRHRQGGDWQLMMTERHWWGHHYMICVVFDADGLSTACTLCEVVPGRYRGWGQDLLDWFRP
jgi:hypothetical protein